MLSLPTAVERVVRDLRDDILRGRLRAGDRLPSERDLVERAGVNRGAVREGLRALAQLGLIEIMPRGAQVAPLSEASLDVLGHLLELDDLPDAELADQVLEVHGHVFSAAMRMAVERGSDDELERVRKQLEQITRDDVAEESYADSMHELVSLLVGASGNFVLRLVRQGLEMQFWDRLHRIKGLSIRISPELLHDLVDQLDSAVADRDASKASDLALRFLRAHRDRIVELLQEEHAKQARTALQEGLATSLLQHLRVLEETGT
jgi:DNA-binding FadR family transcriptional regulator